MTTLLGRLRSQREGVRGRLGNPKGTCTLLWLVACTQSDVWIPPSPGNGTQVYPLWEHVLSVLLRSQDDVWGSQSLPSWGPRMMSGAASLRPPQVPGWCLGQPVSILSLPLSLQELFSREAWERKGLHVYCSFSLSFAVCLWGQKARGHEPVVWRGVFLLGESYGQRSLTGCSPWGRRESDMTDATMRTCPEESEHLASVLRNFLVWGRGRWNTKNNPWGRGRWNTKNNPVERQEAGLHQSSSERRARGQGRHVIPWSGSQSRGAGARGNEWGGGGRRLCCQPGTPWHQVGLTAASEKQQSCFSGSLLRGGRGSSRVCWLCPLFRELSMRSCSSALRMHGWVSRVGAVASLTSESTEKSQKRRWVEGKSAYQVPSGHALQSWSHSRQLIIRVAVGISG